jgi:hypothetical protein
VKIKGLKKFIDDLDKAANGGFEEQLELWLEAMGMEFLDIIQDEIIKTKTVDTRRLLNSFNRSDKDNVWELNSGKLTLHVGTNVHYASHVNDGHNTVDLDSGKDSRWVPGYWEGDHFVYDPNATDANGKPTGMLLIQRWVDGTGYWDHAFAIFAKMFDKSLEKKLQAWLDKF